MPAITIVTPSFNKGPYVAATIRSVIAQTMHDWEMIIVDSGSLDDSVARVRDFSDPRIRLSETKLGGRARRETTDWRTPASNGSSFSTPTICWNPTSSSDQCVVVVGSWQEFPAHNRSRQQRKSSQPTFICFGATSGSTASEIASASSRRRCPIRRKRNYLSPFLLLACRSQRFWRLRGTRRSVERSRFQRPLRSTCDQVRGLWRS